MNAVVASPLMDLIRLYFPPEEWERAACVANAEGARLPGRVQDEGYIGCGHGTRAARSHGPFRILDVCFDPALNPDSWFTPEQWAHVDDLNVNVWMASIIWARWGWRAWSTCEQCGACEVRGKPIPRPRGPEAGQGRADAAARPLTASEMEGIIRRYWPEDQVANAMCISRAECGAAWNGDPERCVGREPRVNCDGSAAQADRFSYGPFQVFDACWDPNLNRNSPFSREQWASRMDPNVNAWMASYLYSRSGWGIWSTARGCGLANVGPGPILHPEGPVGALPEPEPCDPNDPANWGESGSECAPDGRVYDYRWNRCLADGRGDFERFNYRTVPGQCEGPPPPIQIENPAGTAFVVGITAFVASVGLWWRLARGGSL